MIESSKEVEFTTPSTSVTTERNRLMSWDSLVQGLKNTGDVIPSPKNSIALGQFGFVIKIPKLIFTFLAKLPYTFFKLAYEGAKLVTKGLSSIRRVLFVAK